MQINGRGTKEPGDSHTGLNSDPAEQLAVIPHKRSRRNPALERLLNIKNFALLEKFYCTCKETANVIQMPPAAKQPTLAAENQNTVQPEELSKRRLKTRSLKENQENPIDASRLKKTDSKELKESGTKNQDLRKRSSNKEIESKKRPRETELKKNEEFKKPSAIKSVPDLDSVDLEDPGMCAEYAQEIIEYLMGREKVFMPSADYIDLHPELKWNMRTILVDWLIEVHSSLRLLPETLFLAINFMDRFLSRRVCNLSKFQLVGLAALFVASKTEEITCPSISGFMKMTDGAFQETEMLHAEQYMLQILDFDIWAPGPLTFIRRISKIDEYNYENRTLAKFFAEVALLDHMFLKFPPSLIAAASMFLARRLHGNKSWSSLFEYASGYTEKEMDECLKQILKVLCAEQDPESYFFSKKYAGRRYQRAIDAVKHMSADIGPQKENEDPKPKSLSRNSQKENLPAAI